MAPSPLGCLLQLAPITVPDHSPGSCEDKVPWAPRGRGWRAGGGGGPCGAAGARLSWSGLFSLLPAACGAAEVLSGQEWPAQQRGAVSSQPQLSPSPTGGNPASAAGSQVASHQACRKVRGGGKKRPRAGGGASRGHAHLWETPGSRLPYPGPLSVLSHSVIQQTSLSTFKAEPHPGSVPASTPPQHLLWGEKAQSCCEWLGWGRGTLQMPSCAQSLRKLKR